MKAKLLFAIVLVLSASAIKAQRKQIDSLQRIVTGAAADSDKVKAYFDIGALYLYIKPDSTIIMGQRAYALAAATKNVYYKRRSLVLLANGYVSLGNYTKGMKLYYDCIRLAEDGHDTYAIIQTYNNIGSTYIQMPDYGKALQFLRMAQKELARYAAAHQDLPGRFRVIKVYILNNLEECFLYTDKLDSAAYYIKAGIQCENLYHVNDLRPAFLGDMGDLEAKRGNKAAALKYFGQATNAWLASRDLANLDLAYFSYAKLYEKFRQADSAIFYAQKAMSSAVEGNFLADEAKAAKLLYQLYDAQHNTPLAYQYYKTATQINDSIINKDKIMELASMDFEQKQHQDELAAAQLAYRNTVRNYVFAAGLAILALLALVFWRNARHRKKANDLLHEQKEEIEATLEQLQATQTQLIQSEKMASLGELTAGIAHEIQNPLNFVNNFAEVSGELLDELKEEAAGGRTANVTALADDLSKNLEKIRHHGQRADSIVKGMLQHSRASSGQKEPVNLNALADEYLRLAYHGLRAKDKDFNAELLTNFDPKLPKVNVIPQEIGRVLLNVLNNAFYAVREKAKTAGPGYKPEVAVTTTHQNGAVTLCVMDNGDGVPEAIKDKILQPFFTTKPTGEGTGLGLSLSYDIVVKGHGGKIDIESKEGEGAEFGISLPLNA